MEWNRHSYVYKARLYDFSMLCKILANVCMSGVVKNKCCQFETCILIATLWPPLPPLLLISKYLKKHVLIKIPFMEFSTAEQQEHLCNTHPVFFYRFTRNTQKLNKTIFILGVLHLKFIDISYVIEAKIKLCKFYSIHYIVKNNTYKYVLSCK